MVPVLVHVLPRFRNVPQYRKGNTLVSEQAQEINLIYGFFHLDGFVWGSDLLSTDGFNDVEGKHCSGRNTLWQLKNPVELRYERSRHAWDDKGWVFISFSAHQSDKVHCAVHKLTTIVCNDSVDEGHACRINIVTSVRPRTCSKSESLKKKRQIREHFNPYNFIKKEARESTVQTHEHYRKITLYQL